MKNNKIIKFLVLSVIALILTVNCKTIIKINKDIINTQTDYLPSLFHFEKGEIEKALLTLPAKEKDSFITAMEKAILNFYLGRPYTKELARFSFQIDQRTRYKISRGVKTLFWIETPGGYYAAEHEIILMHLLLGWGYAKEGKPEKARVEAKKASILLQDAWSEEGRFDDPFF